MVQCIGCFDTGVSPDGMVENIRQLQLSPAAVRKPVLGAERSNRDRIYRVLPPDCG